MAEFLRPDIYVEEIPGQPTATVVPVSTGGFVGVSQRGKLNEPVLIGNLSDYKREFGTFFQGNYLPYSIFKYFAEGGSRAWVIRIAGSGSAKSTISIPGLDAANTLTVNAKSEGSWGNSTKVEFIKFESKIKTPAIAGAITTAELKTVIGLEFGDVLRIYVAPAEQHDVIIAKIDIATNTVTFKSITLVNALAVDSRVASPSQHRAFTKVKADVLTGAATQLEVNDGKNFRVGMVVTIGDLLDNVTLILTSIEGNILKFASTVLPAIIAISSYVVSQEFKMQSFENGLLKESFNFLSLSALDNRDHIENKLLGDGNQSFLFEVTDLGAGDLIPNLPEPLSYSLATGLDGATPTDGDFIGDPFLSTGLYAFDKIGDSSNLNFFAIPGITSVGVHSEMIGYASSKGNQIAILDMPLALDTGVEMEQYRSVTLNKDSSFAAIYGPWETIIDPENRDQQINMPPSPFLSGIYSSIAINRGIHKAPANEPISSAIGVVHKISNAEHDLLDPKGVNVIRSIRGEGLKVMGSNTLQVSHDGLHEISVRRVLNFIKNSLEPLLRIFLFEPNNEVTQSMIFSSIDTFMTNIWLEEMLFPREDKSKAYFIKIDEENNPREAILAQIKYIDLFVSPVLPIKFIKLNLHLSPGGILINES